MGHQRMKNITSRERQLTISKGFVCIKKDQYQIMLGFIPFQPTIMKVKKRFSHESLASFSSVPLVLERKENPTFSYIMSFESPENMYICIYKI